MALPGTVGRLPAYNVPLDLFPWLLAVAVSAIVALSVAGTYDEPLSSVKERGGFLIASILSAGLLVAFFFIVGRAVPRTVLLLYVPTFYVFLELWRIAAEKMVPIGIRPVLVLGSGEDARRAAEALERGEITGHSLQRWQQDLAVFRGVASGNDLHFATDSETPLDVVFASELPEDRSMLVALLEGSLKHDFDLWILPGLTDIVASRVVTRSMGDLPLTPVTTRGATPLANTFRRIVDLVLGSVLFVATLPLLVAATAAVVLESRGAPWIRQKRVGKDGRIFHMLKIRSMRADAEAGTGPRLAEPNDERLTRLGPFLRKTRIDELPQLILVLTGSMSLIGPRPERPEFVARYEKEVPAYRLRHMLKPGLTGLAQVMGVYATKTDVKLRYDLGYLFHWNPFLDGFILVRTVSTVLRGTGV